MQTLREVLVEDRAETNHIVYPVAVGPAVVTPGNPGVFTVDLTFEYKPKT